MLKKAPLCSSSPPRKTGEIFLSKSDKALLYRFPPKKTRVKLPIKPNCYSFFYEILLGKFFYEIEKMKIGKWRKETFFLKTIISILLTFFIVRVVLWGAFLYKSDISCSGTKRFTNLSPKSSPSFSSFSLLLFLELNYSFPLFSGGIQYHRFGYIKVNSHQRSTFYSYMAYNTYIIRCFFGFGKTPLAINPMTTG